MKTWLKTKLLGILIWALLVQTVWPLATVPVSAATRSDAESATSALFSLTDLRIVDVQTVASSSDMPAGSLPRLSFHGPAAGTSPGLPPITFLPSARPPALPQNGPLATPIPLSQLTVQVLGPIVASVGTPIGSGELYTAVIRNSSAYTAYSIYLGAVFPTFFLADGGHSLVSSSGDIPFSVITGTGTLTWTPTTTYDLLPGEVITLNFKLRATCDAQSGQQMRVLIHYNADPPPAGADEINSGGLNIITGRGNLVIKKTPALQNLGTPDFGKPITWHVIVQNTGLGALFDAVITDTGGISLSQPSGDLVPSVTIPRLEINETRVYTVVGTVEACNFTNIAQGSWQCGNLVGDATYTNPLTTTASVLFTPEIPRVNIQVSPPITCPYCTPVTRTIALTITNTGGPAGRFRLDSTLESGFWQVVPGSVSAGWAYDPANGVFSYTAGSPTGTLPNTAGGPITLTFDVYPSSSPVCSQGSGEIAFEPHFNDICTGNPFRANAAETGYTYGEGQQPGLSVTKNGPAIVASGQVFTYLVTVSGQNPGQMAMPVRVTDTLPAPFQLIGPIVPSSGVTGVVGSQVTWAFTPTANPFSETLYYVVRVLTDTQSGGACQSSHMVNNQVQAVAQPACPGCPTITDSAQVETVIQNNEGVFPFNGAAGSNEVCGPGGFVINTHYLITGSTIITWAGAVYTEALGTPIGGGALPGPVYLNYLSGTLNVTVNGVDYSALLTPVVTGGGQLVIDLSPLQAAGAPTQNLTLWLTYTVGFTEGALAGAVERSFYDWSQLYLPGVSDQDACAANGAFNQALPLTIGRGDLSVGLAPRILNRCTANPVVLTVNDNTPGRLTDHIVITYSASSAEVASARNFVFAGSLAAISPIAIVTDVAHGLITFTLPVSADLNGSGEIRFEVDVDCNVESVWQASITYQSQCAVPHSHTTVRDHLYQAPSLILFATPIRYTLREKEVLWKFFVINNGNYTATNVVVRNDLSNLQFTGFVADTPTVITGLVGASVFFTLPQLAPNEMHAFTVTAEAISCQPLYVDLRASYACFGAVCANPTAHVDLDTPPPYLLTNNGQSADLPMCDLGQVVFTTKNASSDITLYQLNITETLSGLTPVSGAPITLTIFNDQGVPVATTTGFTPTQSWSGPDLRLTWWYTAAPPEVYTWFNALPPLYVVHIQIPVRTSCVPPATPQSFASASALGPCNQKLSYTENAVTLRTLAPDMRVNKQGRAATGSFGETVYAEPGDMVVWRIEAQNIDSARSYVAHNVMLSDTWPANFNFVTATLAFTPTIITAQNLITWDIGDMYPAASHVFYITGTVGMTDGACSPQTTNYTLLRFGCDHDGCTSGLSPMDTANLVARPNLTVTLTPDPINTCGGTVAVTIRNNGSRAYTNALTLTIPSGFAYDGLVYSELAVSEIVTDPTTPVFRWDEIPGRTITASYEFTLVVRLRSASPGGTFCPSADGRTITAMLGYDDHPVCASSGPYLVTNNATLTGLDPILAVNKMPDTVTLATGEWITWTIRVTNTGSGVADNVIVTDTVGDNYTGIGAGVSSNGETPTIAGHTITWVLSSPIDPGSVWTATVWAQLLTIGDNRNIVTATAYCASGCWSTSANDTSRVTLLQEFDKSPTVQTGTIGSLVVFTISASLSDEDALYRNLTLTDTLPAGLGYVSSVLTYTYDQDDSGGTTVVSSTPTVAPALYASGAVVWRLGDVSGTVGINGVITAVIQNATAAFDGARLVNDLRMTYVDDGIPYLYTDTADVDVLEPLLHLGKTYITPYGCSATLLVDNFNGGVSGWSNTGGGTWVLTNGTYQAPDNGSGIGRISRKGDNGWTDYSYSAMVRSTSTTGHFGLIFRGPTAGTNTFYRFRWGTESSNNRRLERVVSNSVQATLSQHTAPYVLNRWYHVEVRVEGTRIRIYVDGVQIFDVNDASANALTNGNIGVYAINQTYAYFDDILVTRLDRQACTVGANDLVTYTLIVSNQARLTGYDLVITDVLPAGMSFVTSTMSSNDPAATVVYTPAVGATGVLTWGVNQLAAITPFNPLAHTALTLTVVLQVVDGITANITMPNQAFLTYDAWLGNTEPTTITRPYSGGSHSAAVRTVNGTLIKTVTFAPPPTATLGTLVTYTIIVPNQPITATLYNVLVTDTIDSRLYIENVTIGGGTGGVPTWAGQQVTATFTSIPHDTQAYITVTARISHEWPSAAGDANAGETITNIARMTHSTAPVTTSNQVSTTVGEPNLLLRKSVASSTGSLTGLNGTALLTYTIRLTNTGSSPAYSVHITDTLPAGISVTALYGGDDRSGPVAGPGTLTWTVNVISNVAPANVVVLTYTAQVSLALAASWLTNTVNVRYTSLTETVPGVRPYTGTTTATVGTDTPTVRKDTDPLTLRVGDQVTYTLVFTVPAGTVGMGGNSYLRDTLPPGVWYITDSETLAWTPAAVAPISFTARTDGVSGASQVVTWTFGTPITSTQNEPTVITLTFRAQATGINASGGAVWTPYGVIHAITNVVGLWQRGIFIGNDDANNQVIQPVLSISKRATPPSGAWVGANELITYTLTITNSGYGPAYDIVITDVLPVGIDYVGVISSPNPAGAPITETRVGQALTYTVGELAAGPGATMLITILARVTDTIGANLTLTNAAAIPYYDSQPGDGPGPYTPDEREYTDGSDTVSHHTVDAAILKTVTPLTATLGDVITYVLVVPATPITATLYNVTVTDQLDSRLQLHTVTDGPDGSVAVAGNAFTVTYPSIPHGEQRFITITTVLSDPLGAIAGNVITNLAVLRHQDGGPTPSNPVTVTVEEPSVTLDKSVQVPHDPLGVGDMVTYTLTLSNTGTWPAYDLVITDSLPTGLNFIATVGFTVTDPTTATLGGDYPAWTVSQLNVGGYVYITFTAQVAPDVGAGLVLTNAAWGHYDGQPGSNPGEREYPIPTDTVPVDTGYPALDLEKSAEPPVVQASGLLTYALIVTNTGIVSATGVVVTDAVPANTSYLSCGPLPCGESGGVVSWTLGTLDIGVPRVLTMLVQVALPLPDNTILTNTAWVTSTEGVTDTDTVTTPVTSAPILNIVKFSTDANSGDLRPGDRLTYTLVVSNTGNETATGVTISDTVPTHTTYVPGSIAGGDSRSDAGLPALVWTINNLPPGVPIYLTYAVTLNLPLTNGLQIVNTAAVTCTQVPTPTTDTVTDTITASHMLDVAKSAEPPVVQSGDMLTYTLFYTITGGEPVYGVMVSDTTPANTTFFTAIPPATSDPGVGNSGPVVWNLGDFLPPESGITQATGVLTLVVQIDSPLVSGTVLYNAVIITDTSGITDTDEVTTPVQSSHSLSITKSADPAVVQAGDLLTYTLAWAVTGNEPAFGVTISDTVPQSTTYDHCEPAAICSESGGVVIWSLGDQYPPASGVVTLVVQVASPLVSGTLIHNAVVITDTSGLTDTDEVTTPVQSNHSLSITKAADPAIVQAGDLLTYTLAWAVSGNEPAFGVTVSDTVPVNTTYDHCEPAAICSESGGVVIWSMGDQSPPASGVVTLVVLVDSAVPSGTLIYNAVAITDTSGLTDTDEITTPVEGRSDLAVAKADDPDPVIVGTVLTYTLIVTNNGPSVARNVMVTDTLPPEVEFVSATPPQSSGPNPLVWNLGDLAVGEIRYLTLTVHVLVTTTDVFTNAVVIGSDTPDDNSDNNEDEESTTPLIPGLELVKIVSVGQAVRNMPFTYTIRITNTGQLTFNPLIVTDTLPNDFHYTPGTGNPAEPDIQVGQTLIWSNLGTLAPGESITLSFGVTATPGILGTYYNVVTATGITPVGPVTDTDDVPVQINDPAVELTKQIVGVDTDLVAPNYITFTLTITNVGISAIDVLPLVDQYDTYYLSFVNATPYPDQDEDDGLITWNDLTGPAPNGFGRNLLPGESFVITTVFRIANSIDVTTTNVATVTNAVDVYDNPPNDDDDIVEFGGNPDRYPTPVTLLYLRATGEGNAVRVEWETAAELDTAGFDLYRSTSEQWTDAEPVAYLPATGSGSRYSYLDTGVEVGRRYWYWLAERTTGDAALSSIFGPAEVKWLIHRLYLPLILNIWR